METLTQAIAAKFKELYGNDPACIVQAPGRVNLIGEHTDYSGGFVLPVAIDRMIVIAVEKTGDDSIEGYSIDFDGKAACSVGSYNPDHEAGWFRYIMGTLDVLEKSGREIGGFRFVFGGSIPIGSGLSSSAALETGTLTAMEALYGFKVDDVEAASLCQKAENEFVGMNCGIMDQFISRMGKKDHALFIDCNDLSYRTVPINLDGCQWLVIDSKKRRGLVDSEYNNRRKECEEALKVSQSTLTGRAIETLQDVAVDDLPELEKACGTTVFKRLKHVVTENNRVRGALDALASGDSKAMGERLYASHASLRDDFEVSCVELDMLVDILAETEGVAGARLTGAGFGGCVIALVADDAVETVKRNIDTQYKPKSLAEGTKAEIWPVTISDGAGQIQ